MGQKSLTFIRLIMICYTVPWWPSWLSDQLAFSNLESEEFQDCHHGCHLGYWNWAIQQFWTSMSAWRLPSSFGSIWLTVWEETWVEEFQDGGQLGYWNRTVLAVLCIIPQCLPSSLSSIRFTIQADVIWIFKMAAMMAILDIRTEPF